MSNVEVFRPRANLIYAAIGSLFALLYLWSESYSASTRGLATSALGAGAVIALLHLLLIRPRIIFGDEGMVIINPLHRYAIGWADLIEVDTKWALTVTTPGFKVSAWAASAAGAGFLPLGGIRSGRSGLGMTIGRLPTVSHDDLKGSGIDASAGAVRISDLPHRDSGAAAIELRRRVKRFNERKLNTIPSTKSVEIIPTLICVVLVIAASLIGAA